MSDTDTDTDADTDADTVTACPHCDSTHVRRRSSKLPDRQRQSSKPWYCGDCKRPADHLVERAARGHATPPLNGLAQALHEADTIAEALDAE